MVNPVLTLIFDFLVIGTASAILAALYAEYRGSQPPAVGQAPARAFRHVRSAQRPLLVGSTDRRGRGATTRRRRLIAA